jgi:hypothetical protein
MRGDLFYDLRNIYKPWEVSRFGFRYFGVGLGDADTVASAAHADTRPEDRPPPVRLVSGG